MLTPTLFKSLTRTFSANFKSSLPDLTTWKHVGGSIRWFTKSTTLPKVKKVWQLFWLMEAQRASKGRLEWSCPMWRLATSALWTHSHPTTHILCARLRKHQDYLSTAFSTPWSSNGKRTSKERLTKTVLMIWCGSAKRPRKELTSMVFKESTTLKQWVLSKISFPLSPQQMRLSQQLAFLSVSSFWLVATNEWTTTCNTWVRQEWVCRLCLTKKRKTAWYVVE